MTDLESYAQAVNETLQERNMGYNPGHRLCYDHRDFPDRQAPVAICRAIEAQLTPCALAFWVDWYDLQSAVTLAQRQGLDTAVRYVENLAFTTQETNQ